jgi:transcriptional regulator with XRE-family HTH domain
MDNSFESANSTSTEGLLDPASIREIVLCPTPTLRPSSLWEIPARSRASRTTAPQVGVQVGVESLNGSSEGRSLIGTLACPSEARQATQMDKPTGDPELGAKLRGMREKAGLSQVELAKRLKIARSQVSRVETGARSTEIEVLERWYRECGYTLETVQVGTAAQANSLALAVAAVPKDQIDAVLAVVAAWPTLPDLKRGRILGIIEPD